MTSAVGRATMRRVRNPNVYSALLVVAATVLGATWLYGYRSSEALEYIDRSGHRFHPTETISTQPWWSVYATVGLIVVGVGVVLVLLPGCRHVIERLSARLVERPETRLNQRRD